MRRLLLPSPNGSTIAARLASASADVIGMSLRNRRAAAEWLMQRRAEDPTLKVSIVAAGERWPDGGLRPAIEDQWGAGALVSELVERGWSDLSPEARSSVGLFKSVGADIASALRDCCSGRELIDINFADDVETAAQIDESDTVPILKGEAFTVVQPSNSRSIRT
jgi:2-phosphosulfolactate phosphatase